MQMLITLKPEFDQNNHAKALVTLVVLKGQHPSNYNISGSRATYHLIDHTTLNEQLLMVSVAPFVAS
jgi:hypothetical protein